MMRKIFLFSALLLTSMSALSQTITVNIQGVISQRGHLLVQLCQQVNSKKYCDYHQAAPALQPTTLVYFTQIPPGIYGIEVFHDENDNRTLDHDASGIPTEGYGFSRDARGIWGPPDFSKMAVTIPVSDTTFNLHLFY